METVAVEAAEQPVVAAGASTRVGRRRSANQDAHVCGPRWFAVADGIGGHEGGALASEIAIAGLRGRAPISSPNDLNVIVGELNAEVRDASSRHGWSGMGTTLVAATPVDGGFAVVSIGDSRCYRLAHGELSLLTHDHSHVQELVDAGRISNEAAGRHRLRHVITRALGIDAEPWPDVGFVPAPVGRLMLCSDGLSSTLTAGAIGRVLVGVADPQAAAERLVELAAERGAADDVTALVVDAADGVR